MTQHSSSTPAKQELVQEPRVISRRAVIRSAAAAAIGLPFVPALVACSSADGPGSSSASGPGSATSPGGAGSASGTSAAVTPAGGSSSSGNRVSSSSAPPSMSKINALTSFEDDPAFTPDAMALTLMKSDHGIDVNQATLVGANTAITALIAGQVDIIVSSLVAGVAAAEQGQDITAVFPGVMVPEHVIITNDKIKSWDDVAGKTFGATRATPSQRLILLQSAIPRINARAYGPYNENREIWHAHQCHVTIPVRLCPCCRCAVSCAPPTSAHLRAPPSPPQRTWRAALERNSAYCTSSTYRFRSRPRPP